MPSKANKACCIWRQWINVIAYLLMMLVSVLGASLRFDNTSVPGVVSRYNPDIWMAEYANIVFGILSLVWLLAFIVYQLFPKTMHDKHVRRVDVAFWFLSVLGTVWTFAFYYDVQWLALLMGIGYTAAALYLYLDLGIGKERVTHKTYWLVHVPFALIAASALFHMLGQFNIFCQAYGWTWWGTTQSEWALIWLLILTFVGLTFINKRTDMVFGTAFVWWSAGIAAYQMGHSMIVTTTAAFMALLFAMATYASCFHSPRAVSRGGK